MPISEPTPNGARGVSPRVSVLLPVHNAESTLSSCLRSLARQREERWECIAVDDGSSDASAAILRAAAARDARIKLIRRGHSGIVGALEAGLAHCRAPLVARMDADDVMHRDRLAAQCDRLDAEPRLAGVGCRVRIFPRDALTPGRRAYERWLNTIACPDDVVKESLVECPIAHPTLVIRRPILEALGYRDVSGPEDYDLILRLLGRGHALAVVPRRLLAWRDHPGRLSRTDPRYALERFTARKAAHLAEFVLGEDPEYVLWGYGETGRALRTALIVHGKRPGSIVELHPRRIGQRIHGAEVVSPDALRERARQMIVVSVAGAGPRAQIRAALREMGYAEPRDFVCTA